jgi:hypothetical protein
MASRGKRRPMRRRPQQQREDAAEVQRSLDMAARNVLRMVSSPAQLQSELHDRELVLEEADRLAQMDPSPDNLRRFRAARADRDAFSRAMQLIEREQATG